jgi:hypothetical protein
MVNDPNHGILSSATVCLWPVAHTSFTEYLAEVLYDFLRYRSQKRPGFKMQCTGAHWEHHQHNHTVFENGVPVDKRKGQSDRIIDFDFTVRQNPRILM